MTNDITKMSRDDGATYDERDMGWLIETLAADLAKAYVVDSEGRPAEPALYTGAVEDVLEVLFARGLDPTTIRRLLK